MAKFLIVLAAALLQANAGPLELNPLAWAMKGPRMGLEIGANVVGGVRDGLVSNGLEFAAGPLGMVQSGLQTPVGVLSGFESKMPSFQLPSFSGLTGAGQDNQGFGGMMSNMFAMPQKIIGQATDMFGQGQGLLGGFAGQSQELLGGISGQVQNSVAKLQDSLAELQGQIDTEQLIQMIKDNAAKAQEKTQGALAGAKEQVDAIQKKVQEMKAQFGPQAQEMVQTIMQDLQKQAQEAAAAGENEVAVKVQEQMKQVVERANGLMGQLQTVNSAEDAQKIAAQFKSDFSALYEKAKKQ